DTVQTLKKEIYECEKLDEVEGLLLPFYHFWGDFCYIRNTRRTHSHEIRAFKNKGIVKSYKDSQGFRKYDSVEAYEAGQKGEKLKVVKVDVPIYHYSYVRNPKLMAKKSNFFRRFWHSDEEVKRREREKFDYNEVDKLETFKGNHPKYVNGFISKKDWNFK